LWQLLLGHDGMLRQSGRLVDGAALDHDFIPASALRPASVIRTVATSILRVPAATRSAGTVARSARTRSLSWAGGGLKLIVDLVVRSPSTFLAAAWAR
jgi:hypothetical protein